MNDILTVPRIGTEATMDSREIADLTGKRHADVLRDIEAQLSRIGDERKFASVYMGGNGEERKCYRLPYRETMILISGYSVELRARVVDRWMELEGKAHKVPISYSAALRLAAEQAEQLELQAPMVEAYESLMKTDRAMSITDASKHFGLHPKLQVFPFLRDHGYLTIQDLPSMKAIEADIMTLRQAENKAQGKTYPQAVVEANQLDNFRRLVAYRILGNPSKELLS